MHSTLSTAERRPGWLGGGATTTRCGIRRSDGFIVAILKSELWIVEPGTVFVNRATAELGPYSSRITQYYAALRNYATVRIIA